MAKRVYGVQIHYVDPVTGGRSWQQVPLCGPGSPMWQSSPNILRLVDWYTGRGYFRERVVSRLANSTETIVKDSAPHLPKLRNRRGFRGVCNWPLFSSALGISCATLCKEDSL